MSNGYAIVVPNYDKRRGIDVPFLIGENVYKELIKEDELGFSLVYADETIFPDLSNKVVLRDTVRGRKVYVINQLTLPPNETIMGVLLIIDTLRRCDAEEIVVVEPYIPFLRQDRPQGREPITSRLIGDLYSTAGANRVMTFHPHVEQAGMAFGSDCPIEVLPTYKYIADCYKERCFRRGENLDNSVVCAPDLGAVKGARRFANRLGLSIVVISKERTDIDTTGVEQLIGNVEGKKVITFDDVIDTGGSSLNAREYLIDKGATSVDICATHLGFNNDSKGNNRRREIVERGINIIGTDSIPHTFTEEELRYFDIYPLAPLIARIISYRSRGKSISSFFNS